MLEVQIATAKVNKYASRESGDTLEIVEKPGMAGGFTAILVDGQGSGRAAKAISNLVAGKCLSLIKDGARDGVAARAASDYLYSLRYGQVSATLNILSADFATNTMVITCNNPIPAYVVRPSEKTASELVTLKLEVTPIGIYPRTRPHIYEYPLEPGWWAFAFTDGITGAGSRYNKSIDLPTVITNLISQEDANAQSCADALLELAISYDQRRPADDMSVVVMAVKNGSGEDGDSIPRRISMNIPYLPVIGS
ncbi:MAG: SpoIIE family protein phosphatase [Chloroflexi bacterium]|uniref:Serine/threonine-protein phosphatase n=1 Tax=Candidatus Chlorohelix allophototropha TaxID=3003348 RepID=A0A8T7M7D5_9CHLR|nr:SpoIIE family protein phosphatase [Chloroflexota bacterium]WJW69933.1 serine/threonine-protein phosphatase [Chloroflexota bacterium L227-S17]